MRKPAFCICENKDANQLRGNREADQRLCFRYIDRKIALFLNTKSQASSHLLWLCSPVCVGPGQKPRFSQKEAQIVSAQTKVIETDTNNKYKSQLCSCKSSDNINPLVTYGLSHPYHLDESTFIYRGIWGNF